MICIIPARGGSKRIHEKNLKELDGIPIIGHTLNRAKKSELFSEIYVSTDNESIRNISKRFGADIIDRPQNLADDFTPTLDVMAHAVGSEGLTRKTLVCCLYPVTPLLDFARITEATKILDQEECTYVFPVIPLSGQVQRSFVCDPEGRVIEFEKETSEKRTQDLEKLYVDAGQFYLGEAQTWREKIPIFSTSSRVLPLDPWEVLDVDTPQDWEIMESVYHMRLTRQANLLNRGKIE
jgi:pseudaminic acid cytidylyltransferase